MDANSAESWPSWAELRRRRTPLARMAAAWRRRSSGVSLAGLSAPGERILYGRRPNLANVVGLVALVYALVLTFTSNDAAQRWLKSGWRWLQERATTMQLLVLLHTWFFAYYITTESMLAIGTLWACFWAVLLLQTAAFVKTVWFRQRVGIETFGEESGARRT